jgi:hypothetical protein
MSFISEIKHVAKGVSEPIRSSKRNPLDFDTQFTGVFTDRLFTFESGL